MGVPVAGGSRGYVEIVFEQGEGASKTFCLTLQLSKALRLGDQQGKGPK